MSTLTATATFFRNTMHDAAADMLNLGGGVHPSDGLYLFKEKLSGVQTINITLFEQELITQRLGFQPAPLR